jgi:hypothetical protein
MPPPRPVDRDNTAALLRRESKPQDVDVSAAQAAAYVRPDIDLEEGEDLKRPIGDEVTWAESTPEGDISVAALIPRR